MKRFLLFIGLLCTFNNLSAQQKVTENTKANGIEDVYVHLKFANTIVVKNWSKNEISIEATVNLDDNEHNDYFSLKADKIGETYKIVSDYGEYFKKYRSYYAHKQSHTDEDNNEQNEDKNCCNNKYSNIVNYVIYVPNNMQLNIKSISGSVEADSFIGTLKLDLISGNITIKKHSKDMYLKTISGDIDIYVDDAKLEAKTLTGGVYSDLDIDFSQNKKSGYGSKIKTTINKGTAFLKLNTISGDIFLRKI